MAALLQRGIQHKTIRHDSASLATAYNKCFFFFFLPLFVLHLVLLYGCNEDMAHLMTALISSKPVQLGIIMTFMKITAVVTVGHSVQFVRWADDTVQWKKTKQVITSPHSDSPHQLASPQ